MTAPLMKITFYSKIVLGINNLFFMQHCLSDFYIVQNNICVDPIMDSQWWIQQPDQGGAPPEIF